MRNYAIFILLLVFIFSCKKNTDPIANNNNPLFFMDGIMDNQHLLLEAGVDSFYLQTDYTFNSTNNITEYISEFKKPCANCKESLKIIIRNYTDGTNKPFVFDSVFGLSNYKYYELDTPSYKGTFTATATGTGSITHLWDFGDGTTATSANPTKLFSNNYNSLITYTSSFSNGCSSNITKKLDLSVDTPLLAYPEIVTYTDTLGKKLFFSLNDTNSIASVSWNFGDGDTLGGLNVSHSYAIPGVYLVKASIKKFSGKQIEVSQNIASLNKVLCKANYTFNIVPVLSTKQFSTVILEYTNKNGVVFSTKNTIQNSASFLKLTAVSPYLPNNKNQPTTSFTITGNAVLGNGTQYINFIGFKGKIAFAHP